ncbi:MAG TPA: energy transducer TonB [Verrucomicrobiae bacterium]|jgi:TonB family protein|nr:energy transducer TonB [Verrucomicrobiae bacterium]
MSERSSRRIILIALAISVLLHVALAFWLRLPLPIGSDREHLASSVEILRTLPAVRARTTSPPKQPAHNARHSRSRLVHLAGPPGKHPGADVAVAPTPSPAPVSSVAPCRDPNAKAALALAPSAPDIPADARTQGTNGIAAVLVRVDADGSVLDAAVTGTSGNAGLDEVALSMARAATYVPALLACKPVVGDYTFKVRFAAW